MGDKNDKSKGASGADADETELVDETETTDDDASGDDESGKTVSHSTYKKTVSEAKKAKETARKLAEEKADLETRLLAAEGNKDEQIKSLQTKLAETTKKNKDIYGAMARKSLNSQIKAEAAKAGCIDPDAVISLADLSELEVDAETFEADADAIKEIVTGLKKSKPYLFSKPGPKINGKLPNGGNKGDDDGKEDLSKLTAQQIRDRLREMDKKN